MLTFEERVKQNMTYAQTFGKEPFDWNFFLAKGYYTTIELMDAKKRAGEWTTCACGNECKVIARDFKGEPRDTELRELGIDFYHVIAYMRETLGLDTHDLKVWSFCEDPLLWEAIELLERIEERSGYLIRLYYGEEKEESN